MVKESGASGSRLSHLALPFTINRSSSLKDNFHDAAASRFLSHHDLGSYESEPNPCDESLWDGYACDFSFLSSVEQTSVGEGVFSGKDEGRTDSKGEPVAESSKLCGQVYSESETKANRIVLGITKQTNADTLSWSDLSVAARLNDFQNQLSMALPVFPTNHSNSNVILEERNAAHVSPTSVPGDLCTASVVNSVSSANASGTVDSVAKGRLPYAKDKVACFNKTVANQSGEENNDRSITNKVSDPPVSVTSMLQIVCPNSSNEKKLDLHGADASVHIEKYSVPSDQNDSDVDSPCWKGTWSYKTAVAAPQAAVVAATSFTASHPMSLERSNHELNGYYRLNPLAPHFVPASAKQTREKPGKDCEGVGSSFWQETGSSTVALSSGNYSFFDPIKAPEVPSSISSAAENCYSSEIQEPRFECVLPHNLDASFGFANQISDSKAASLQQSSNEFHISKRLNPSARQFLPVNAKQTISNHEKQASGDDTIGFQTNAPLTAALTSIDGGILSCVKAELCAPELCNIRQHPFSFDETGTSPHPLNNSHGSPRLESDDRIFGSPSLKPPSSELHASNGLNPLASKLSAACTKQNADDLPSLKKTSSSAASFIYADRKAIDATEARSQPLALRTQSCIGVHVPQVECVLPYKSYGSSVLKSSVIGQPILLEDYFMSNSRLFSKPNATLTVEDIADFQPNASFCVSENAKTSFSSRVEALSDLSQVQNLPLKSSPLKLDVNELLLTMHELSELLIHLHGCSYDLDSLNEQAHVLVKNIMKNLNLYIGNRAQEHRSTDSRHLCASYGPEQTANACKLSIRDLRAKRTEDMSVVHDLQMDEKCSMVSREKDISNNTLQENPQTGEQMNPQALFYRSLWLKAEAARCLAEYEACLSHMKNE